MAVHTRMSRCVGVCVCRCVCIGVCSCVCMCALHKLSNIHYEDVSQRQVCVCVCVRAYVFTWSVRRNGKPTPGIAWTTDITVKIFTILFLLLLCIYILLIYKCVRVCV